MIDIIRVFPQRTSHTPDDKFVYIGRPLFSEMLPDVDEAHISCCFSWDKNYAEKLAWEWGRYYKVKIGGPAFGNVIPEFKPGFYLKNGITITTRGCNNKCWFCEVPRREGKLQLIDEIIPGYMVNDNNLLQAPRSHIEKVFDMLRSQNRGIVFSGGLDAREIDEEIVRFLQSIKIRKIFLAYDDTANYKYMKSASRLLNWLDRRKLGCYVLVGYKGDSQIKAEKRLADMWHLGFLPFAMAYRGPHDPKIPSPLWAALVRKWRRPIAIYNEMSAHAFDD